MLTSINKEMVDIFSDAIAAGMPEIMHLIGKAYSSGIDGIKPDRSEAIKWFTISSEKDYSPSQRALVHCFLNAEGKQDLNRAIGLLEILANKGDSEACLNLGMIYIKNPDVKDYEKAEKWLKMNELSENADALYLLGEIYEDGGNGIEKDLPKATKLFEKASSLGNDKAQAAFQRLTSRLTRKIFVSYSHTDKQYLDEMRSFLRGLEIYEKIAFWSDTQLNTSEKWKDKLFEELKAANLIICLVSQAYLTSEFILNNELPQIYDYSESNIAKIFWIPISYSMYKNTPFATIQSLLDPKFPLASYKDKVDRDKLYMNLCDSITEVSLSDIERTE